jgi:shikimate kinase/3-dehydroquinate synthase
MGTGKSAVAARLAAKLGVAVVDLDRVVEARFGQSISELFARRGEGVFRQMEQQCLRDEVTRRADGVFALGGGTVTSRELRRWLLEQGVVVTLQAPVKVILERIEHETHRPLLQEVDRAATLRALVEDRAAAYAECHVAVQTENLDPDEVAERIAGELRIERVAVPLGSRSYGVEIGAGVRARCREKLEARMASRVFVVTDAHVESLWRADLRPYVDGQTHWTVLPPGEREKTIASVQQVWDDALGQEVDRASWVVALGGGVVGDLAGFAAATLLRGVAFAQLPTTLLAMVDSSVGGKTGFDHACGKNLVGAFHQPGFVQCDTDYLTTLPEREYRAGFAEIIKSAWLDGELAVEKLERLIELQGTALSRWDAAAVTQCIRMAVQLKARVVAQDEHETSGQRALLNLGHTWGHAIEAAEGYQGLRHGEAVALGMVAALYVGCSLGTATERELHRMVRLLESVGLPTEVDPYINESTWKFIAHDKKKRGNAVQFVVPGAPGQTRIERISLVDLPRLTRNLRSGGKSV